MLGSGKVWLVAALFLCVFFQVDSVMAEPQSDGAAAAASKWARIEPKAIELDGKVYSPTCSQAAGSDATYAFWYQQGTADGLVVFFDGGGSCWNDETCCKPRLSGEAAVFDGAAANSVFKAMILPSDDPSRMSGLFDTHETRNPVRDWSKVFISYCTGDVHSGSNTAEYHDPANGKPFKIEHRGWDNAQVVKEWMRKNLPKPHRILICGSSAGAYGAATHFGPLREMYPEARAFYLGDGGMGVTTPEFEKARNESWNYMLPVSIVGAAAQKIPDREVVARLAARFPEDRFAQYTTAHDVVQTNFYAQQGGGPATTNAWTEKMSRELENRQSQTNFRSYVAEGSIHTILRSQLVFNQSSGGMPFVDWLEKFLSDQPLPNSMMCSGCLSPTNK